MWLLLQGVRRTILRSALARYIKSTVLASGNQNFNLIKTAVVWIASISKFKWFYLQRKYKLNYEYKLNISFDHETSQLPFPGQFSRIKHIHSEDHQWVPAPAMLGYADVGGVSHSHRGSGWWRAGLRPEVGGKLCLVQRKWAGVAVDEPQGRLTVSRLGLVL